MRNVLSYLCRKSGRLPNHIEIHHQHRWYIVTHLRDFRAAGLWVRRMPA